MEMLEIKWDRGSMKINLEEFLVNANQTKCKKLLKIIKEKAPEQEEDLKFQVFTYICTKVAELDEKRRNLSSKWYKYHQMKADAREEFIIQNDMANRLLYMGYPVGKEFSQEVKTLKKEWKSCEQIFNQTERDLNRASSLREKLDKVILPLFAY